MATTEVTLDQEAVQAFAAGVRGPVLSAGDDGYDDARAIWNGLIDRRPALIVQPTGAADVVDAVNFAREHGLTLSIKGGGHNVAGNAVNDGGLIIDLSQHARRPRRSVDAAGESTRRRHLGRRGPRDATVRPRGAGRRRLDDGHRGSDTARRHGTYAPQARALDRQSRSRSTSSPRTASSVMRARPRTRISSGRCGAPAATSASSRPSSFRRTRSARWSWSARSSIRSRT